MTITEAVDDLLRRVCLVFDAGAVHAGGTAGRFVTTYLSQLADDLLVALESCEATEQTYLGESYRCLSLAADIPPGKACGQRELFLDVARQGLAFVVVGHTNRDGERASKQEVMALLSEQWTASLLAWAELFPASLDNVPASCRCTVSRCAASRGSTSTCST